MTLNLFKVTLVSVVITLFSGCVTQGQFNHKQVKVLKTEGFRAQQDNSWILDLPTRLLFVTDQSALTTLQANNLQSLGQKLKDVSIEKMIVQGHTDSVGSDMYNQKLSLKRAQSVADIMLHDGFQAKTVKVVGYGATKPIQSNDTEEGRYQNRRVAIVVQP